MTAGGMQNELALEMPSRGLLPRWGLLVLFLIAVAGVIGAVAGNLAGAVFSTFIYFVFVVPVFLAAWMLGLFLSEPFERRGVFADSPWPGGYRSLVAVALGLGVFALALLGMGTVHLLEPSGMVWPAVAVPVIGMMVGWGATRRFLGGVSRAIFLARVHKGDWLYLVAAVPVGILLIAVAFPPGTLWHTEARGYDVLEYHLQLPREYALNNSTAPVGHNVYSYLPANVEMLYLLMMQFAKGVMGGDRATGYVWGAFPAQFTHVLLMLMSAGAIALIPLGTKEKPFLHATGRAVAVVVFLGIPWTLVTGSLAYNEAGMMFFGTLAMGVSLRARPSSGVLAGILLGLAIGCKMTAGIFFAIPVAIIFLRRAVTDSSQFKSLLWAVVLAAGVYAPWAVRAAIYSGGNPVFPVAASTLGANSWSSEQVERFAKGHSAPSGISLSARLKALADNSVFDGQWSLALLALLSAEEISPSPTTRAGTLPAAAESRASTGAAGEQKEPWWKRIGALWWGIPLVLLCSMIAKAGRNDAALLLGILFVQMVGWMYATHLQGRFLLPIAVPLALLAGRGVQGLQLSGEGIVVSAMRIVGGSLVVLHALFTVFLLLPEARLFNGVRPREGTAPVALPIGDAFGSVLNLTAIIEHPEGGVYSSPKKLLLVGDSTAWRYIGDVTYSTVFDGDRFIRLLADPAAETGYLRTLKPAYIFINWAEIARFRATYGFEGMMTVSEMRTRVKALEAVALTHVDGGDGYEFLRVDVGQ